MTLFAQVDFNSGTAGRGTAVSCDTAPIRALDLIPSANAVIGSHIVRSLVHGKPHIVPSSNNAARNLGPFIRLTRGAGRIWGHR